MLHSADKLYQPRAGSVPARVVEFFKANPDEELTTADIAGKFDCSSSLVSGVLQAALRGGLLSSTGRNGSTPAIYRPGPRLLAGEWPEAPASAKPATAPSATPVSIERSRIFQAAQVEEPAPEPVTQAGETIELPGSPVPIVIHVHVHLVQPGAAA